MAGYELTGRWSGLRFLLGPWRWMLLIHEYDEDADRVVILTLQDARPSRQGLRAGAANLPAPRDRTGVGKLAWDMSQDDLGVGTTDQEARQRLERIATLLDAKQEWLRRWTVPLLISMVALLVVGFVSEPLIMALIAGPFTFLSLQLRNRKALERARDANRAVVAAVEGHGMR